MRTLASGPSPPPEGGPGWTTWIVSLAIAVDVSPLRAWKQTIVLPAVFRPTTRWPVGMRAWGRFGFSANSAKSRMSGCS